MNDIFDGANILPRVSTMDADYVETMSPEDVEMIEPEYVGEVEPEIEQEPSPDTIEADVGSGNGVAVNAAGSKITVGVGEINSSKGAGAQISNVQGDINFGNVRSRCAKFDKIPCAPPVVKQPESSDEFCK